MIATRTAPCRRHARLFCVAGCEGFCCAGLLFSVGLAILVVGAAWSISGQAMGGACGPFCTGS